MYLKHLKGFTNKTKKSKCEKKRKWTIYKTTRRNHLKKNKNDNKKVGVLTGGPQENRRERTAPWYGVFRSRQPGLMRDE